MAGCGAFSASLAAEAANLEVPCLVFHSLPEVQKLSQALSCHFLCRRSSRSMDTSCHASASAVPLGPSSTLGGDEGWIDNLGCRKTIADIKRRARKCTLRLAFSANKCYWLSCTEVAVHILTGADCLQSHCHQRLFTRQLQWALQECKRHLNKESGPDTSKQSDRCDPPTNWFYAFFMIGVLSITNATCLIFYTTCCLHLGTFCM